MLIDMPLIGTTVAIGTVGLCCRFRHCLADSAVAQSCGAPKFIRQIVRRMEIPVLAATAKNERRTSAQSRAIGSILRSREESLHNYVFVVGAIWAIAGLGIAFTRASTISLGYIIPSGLIFLLGFAEKKKVFSRSFAVNLFLLTNFTSLFFCSAIAEYRESTVEFHFALVCLMAMQLLGLKAALRWFCFTVVAIFATLYSPLAVHQQVTLGVEITHLLSALMLAITVMWICWQAEKTYLQTTAQMQLLGARDRETSRMLKLAEETASIGHWRWDVRDNKTHFSDKLKKICLSPNLGDINAFTKRFDAPGRRALRKSLRKAAKTTSSFTIELSITEGKQRRYVTCSGFSELGADGKVEAVFGVVRDETKLREATRRLSRKAKELNQLAIVDPLTGLSNRHWFHKQLENMIDEAHRDDELVALIVLDMDGFKEINDSLGHAIGDLVLIETARRLERIVSDSDIVSRLGGDEFTAILRRPKSVEHVRLLGQQIVDAIRLPMQIENNELQVGASIGVGIYPDDTCDAAELFRFADTAMYEAKFSGNDVAVYETSMTEELVKRKRVESQLSEAVSRDEFSLVYQPQFDIAHKRVTGLEALIRWNRDGEVVSPAEFIPVLENSGRIIETGHWILDQVCHQLKTFQRCGIETRIAVNISPVQFRDPGFYAGVVEALTLHDVDPRFLDLEITEGAIISDIKRTAQTLQNLKSLGCMISIDDFGTGYSSLSYLKNFPIDKLKIDRAFVRDFPQKDDGMLAGSIVLLGLSLGMEVLAEGVETKEQLDFLKHYDCHYFQGFYGSKPLSPADCLVFLNQFEMAKPARI